MTIIEFTCRQRLAAAVEGRQIYNDENEMMSVSILKILLSVSLSVCPGEVKFVRFSPFYQNINTKHF